MVDYKKISKNGLFMIIVFAMFSGTLITWEIGQEWTKLYSGDDTIAKEKWTVYAERTWFSLETCIGIGENRTCKSNWYATNVKCPKIEALGGYRTDTRCYYPDNHYEMLKRSIINTKIKDIETDDGLIVNKSVPFYKYGTRGTYVGFITEMFSFEENISSELEFPKQYLIEWKPKDTRNYYLKWTITNIDTSEYIENISHSCKYKFGKVTIDLKEECKHLNYTLIEDDEVYFFFNPTRGTQELDITFVDPYTDNMLSFFPFNGNTVDEQGFYDITAVGAVYSTAQAKNGSGSYYFDGVDGSPGYINISSTGTAPYWANSSSERTISMWIYPTNSTKYQFLFRSDGVTGIWNMHNIPTTYGFYAQWYDGAYHEGIPSPNFNITNATWQMVTITYKVGNGSLYHNGTINATSDPSALVASSPSHISIGIGDSKSVNAFQGYIDEIRIWDRAITAAEVLELYELYDEAPSDSLTVELNNPADDSTNYSKTIAFEFTPTTTGYLENCTLYHNETSWADKASNATELTNGSTNTISFTFTDYGDYVWNINCTDNNSLTSFATANFTVDIDTYIWDKYDNCTNITIEETAGHARTNEPIFINLTDIIFGNATVEIRITNNSCDITDSGSRVEIPRDILNQSSSDNWTDIVFQADVGASTTITYSVLWNNNTTVIEPNYDTNLLWTAPYKMNTISDTTKFWNLTRAVSPVPDSDPSVFDWYNGTFTQHIFDSFQDVYQDGSEVKIIDDGYDAGAEVCNTYYTGKVLQILNCTANDPDVPNAPYYLTYFYNDLRYLELKNPGYINDTYKDIMQTQQWSHNRPDTGNTVQLLWRNETGSWITNNSNTGGAGTNYYPFNTSGAFYVDSSTATEESLLMWKDIGNNQTCCQIDSASGDDDGIFCLTFASSWINAVSLTPAGNLGTGEIRVTMMDNDTTDLETEYQKYWNPLNVTQVEVTVDNSPTVTLNSPTDDSTNYSKTILFGFTPTDDNSFANCSLWTNETTWEQKEINTSEITNNSINYISETFSSRSTFIWNIECYDNASQSAFATANYTVDIKALLQGNVKDRYGNIIEGATIIIIDQSTDTILGTNTSDLNGNWTYVVDTGTYLVVAYNSTNVTLDGDADPHIIVD